VYKEKTQIWKTGALADMKWLLLSISVTLQFDKDLRKREGGRKGRKERKRE